MKRLREPPLPRKVAKPRVKVAVGSKLPVDKALARAVQSPEAQLVHLPGDVLLLVKEYLGKSDCWSLSLVCARMCILFYDVRTTLQCRDTRVYLKHIIADCLEHDYLNRLLFLVPFIGKSNLGFVLTPIFRPCTRIGMHGSLKILGAVHNFPDFDWQTLCEMAAATNQIAVLQFARAMAPSRIEWNKVVFAGIAHIDVVTWLFAQNLYQHGVLYRKKLMNAAARKGTAAVIRYLYYTRRATMNPTAVTYMARHDDLHGLLPWAFGTCNFKANHTVLEVAVRAGADNCARTLINLLSHFSGKITVSDDLLSDAASIGNIAVFDRLCASGDREVIPDEVLFAASERGQLDMLMHIYEKYVTAYDPDTWRNVGWRAAVRMKHCSGDKVREHTAAIRQWVESIAMVMPSIQ